MEDEYQCQWCDVILEDEIWIDYNEGYTCKECYGQFPINRLSFEQVITEPSEWHLLDEEH
jgi:hypothetical protein|tara:strand:+ start:6478 stop:6657 length:180 start_codon:yes stop_codon:yes gene_type:complete